MHGINPHPDRRPVVGVMGGICSGKTTVASVFEAGGFLRIDADRIAHSLLGATDIMKDLRQAFGDAIFNCDGSVNRRSLADAAFADAARLSLLNEIIHPAVIDAIEKRLSSAARPVVLDAALLVETELDRRFCTHLVFVDRPFEQRLRCSVERRGWEADELGRRERMQQPLDMKKARADFVISNTGSIQELGEKVNAIIQRVQDVCSG